MADVVTKSWNLANIGGRRYSTNVAPGSNADVWYDDWNYVVNRTDSLAAVLAAFQAQGYQSVENINNGTAATVGGWFYTVTSIPGYAGSFPRGVARMLCVETNPSPQGDLWQADPSLVFFNNNTPGNLPPNIWLQWWQYNCRSGVQQTTFDVRDKTFYVSNGSEAPGANYPSNNFPWLVLQGAGGFNFNPPPNDVDNYIGLQAQRSQVPHDPGVDPAGGAKMPQNLNAGPMILPNTMTQVRLHMDTSGAQGRFEAWARPRGTPTFTKFSEWLGGETMYDGGLGEELMLWPTNADDRSGCRAMIWPSTTNGEGRHGFRYFGPLELATASNLLDSGD
jgi:hypothetical protein